jgi:peptidyl-prolyl cis-trans isomerase B (cyclophilin B)
MAKHKAPAQVTIASIQQQTVFHELVDRYWKLGALIAVAVAIAILIPTYQRQKAQAQHHGAWDELALQADLGGGLFGGVQGGSPQALALFADQNRDSAVGAWAKAVEIGSRIQEEELEEAGAAAGQLASAWPDHLLSSAKLFPGAEGQGVTLAQAIEAGTGRIEAWEKEHAFLFSNPELPADAPRVRLETSQGPIVVGLYVDRAPQHAENFLKLAREGYYDGTKFHRVVRGSLIQGGDPNTREGEPESWGLGGPETKIADEVDPQLRHFKGALVAWKSPGEPSSHGSQFFFTTADQNHMDGQTVVFGKVLEGESVIEAIESGAVVGDRPQDPAVIQSVQVL